MPTEGKAAHQVVGKSLPRLDASEKVTGRFKYVADLFLPGMLWGKIRRSEIPFGRIVRIDASAAERLPGVRAVITAGDVPAGALNGKNLRDEPILARDRVRYVGEPVAAVAADTREIAEGAVQLIKVEYEPWEPILDVESALKPGVPLLHPDFDSYWHVPGIRNYDNVVSHASLERGDVAGAFAVADIVVEDRFVTHQVHQMSLEARVAIAEVDANGNITVISSHQFPFGLRKELGEIFKTPVGKIRVIAGGIGGGFGGKLDPTVEPLAIVLARRTGRPVKIHLTREEEMMAGSPRQASVIYMRTAAKRDGTLLAREARIMYEAGAYGGDSVGLAGIGLMMAPGPYKWQALKIDSLAVYTNKPNCGSYRGPGGPQPVFAGESQVNRIARELGLDPLEIRLRNAVEDGDLGPSGQVLTRVSLKETLRKAAERIGWDQPLSPAPPDKRRGRGLACTWWTTTSGSACAYVKVNEDGTVGVITGGKEIGTGAMTAGVAQIVAEEMGVEMEDVIIASDDTDSVPYDFGAQGSRTTFMVGNAAIRAARDAKSQLLTLAAEKLGADPGDLECSGKAVRVKGDPSSSMPLADLAKQAQATVGPILGRGCYIQPPAQYDTASVQGSTYPAYNSPSFHTHAAEVEVDEGTGEVKVTRYVVAQDVGFAINPAYVEGQMIGGAVQGLGYALQEEMVYERGRLLNGNFTDYKLPTTMDVPAIETVIVEVPSEHGPYGAKGVGEPPNILSGAVIAEAVGSALGVRFRRLPITAERVLDALENKG